jgi:endonuclease YncB( thermonuclease family)
MTLLLALVLSAQSDFTLPAPAVRDWKAAARASHRRAAFNCQVAYVHDGDTFRCADGTRIRLSAIDAPEMPGACRRGRTCAPGNPFAAKATLAALIDRRVVQCVPTGTTYNRVAAWCSLNGNDLSCSMLKSGQVIRLARFDPTDRLLRC